MKGKNFLMILVGLLAMLLLVGINPAYPGKARGVTDDNIKIAVITDMSGPAVTDYGPYRQGVVNYLKYANEQGDINGRKLKIIIEDDRYSIPTAIAAFKKVLFRDRVLAIIGFGTPTITPLYDKIEKEKIPTFGFSVAESMVIPCKRHVFTHTASYEDGLRSLADYIMKDLKAKDPRMGYVAPDLVWGRKGLDVLNEYTKLYGTKLFDSEILGLSPMDATSQVLSLRRKKINYLFIHHTARVATTLVRDAKKLGFKAVLLGSHPVCSDIVVKMSGEAARNFYGVHSFNPWYSGVPGTKKMLEVFIKHNPGKIIPSIYYVQGWVSAMVVVEGLKRAGQKLSNQNLVRGLEGIKNFYTGDLSAAMNYGPKKHRGSNRIKIFKADVENGRLKAVTEWKKPRS